MINSKIYIYSFYNVASKYLTDFYRDFNALDAKNMM